MVSPQSSDVDGKVWTQNNGFAGVHRLDIATGKIETWEPFKGAPKGEPHNIYDVIPDSQNNAYFTDFRQGQIGRIDAKTGEIALFQTPTPRSAPRRGNMDAQDRLWFGEYRGDRIGMFDTRTSHFKEWKLAPQWSSPYDVVTRQERRSLDRLDGQRPGNPAQSQRPAKRSTICCRAAPTSGGCSSTIPPRR